MQSHPNVSLAQTGLSVNTKCNRHATGTSVVHSVLNLITNIVTKAFLYDCTSTFPMKTPHLQFTYPPFMDQ